MSISLAMCAVDFSSTSMSPEDQAIAERIAELKKELGDDLLILGHHYQRDSIVMHADFLGDSFMLSQKAADSEAKYIVFCGVHFMAESADILTSPEQVVMLPNIRAGCSMADMATLVDVEQAWNEMLSSTDLKDPISRADPAAVARILLADMEVLCALHQTQMGFWNGHLNVRALKGQSSSSPTNILAEIQALQWVLRNFKCLHGRLVSVQVQTFPRLESFYGMAFVRYISDSSQHKFQISVNDIPMVLLSFILNAQRKPSK